MGFSKIAFNSTAGKTNIAVAATAAAATGISLGVEASPNNRGLYYSLDSGLTWNYANVQDASGTVEPRIRYFSGLQPGGGAIFCGSPLSRYFFFQRWNQLEPSCKSARRLSAALCPTVTSNACPIYRAELAVVPGETRCTHG